MEDTFLPMVQILENMPFEDGDPRVQPTPVGVGYEMAPSSNLLSYIDHAGFPTEFNSEIEAIGELEKILEAGQRHVHTLYTYRSVSIAIPLVTDSNDPNKDLLHMRTYQVLRPEMEKVRDVMAFQDTAVQMFAWHMETLATQGKKKVVPEGLYDALIAAVDLLQRIDHIKDSKACLTNDFSRYKRALTVVRGALPDGEALMKESQQMQLFLGNVKYPKNLIFNTLRDAVKRVAGHEEVLLRMLAQAMERIEAERFLTPDGKFALLRALPFLVVLLDGDGAGDASFNVFKQKRVRMKDVQKVFQRYPVVPEYADMAMKMGLVVQKAPHFDVDTMGGLFGSADDAKVAAEYSVTRHWERIKGDYDDYTTVLANMLNEIGTVSFSKSKKTVLFAKEVALTVLRGLQLLQRWSCVLLEAAAWKFMHPCPMEDVKKAGGNTGGRGVEYERVVRQADFSFVWNTEELSAVVEIITMTKSLGSLMSRAEDRLAPYLRLHMHYETQQLVQEDLVPVLHRADKKKRGTMTVLLQLRAIVADWADNVEKTDDYKKYKRRDGRATANVTPRLVGPSTTQLQLVRTLVRALYDESSELRQGSGLLNKEDLKKEDLEALSGFYNSSWAFAHLTDLAGTLRQATDLGDLWYREFHLELSKCVQFPIEMSFPWIITEHIVHTKSAMAGEGTAAADAAAPAGAATDGTGGSKRKKKRDNNAQVKTDPHRSRGQAAVFDMHFTPSFASLLGHVLVEEVLWALDLYNDAAQRALYTLNSQFLYIEIQTEVNLVFDQLVFHLENEVYGYFKDWGASTVLDKVFKRKLEDRRGWGLYTPGRRRYETPMQQHHVQLMGRSVDLARRFAFDMNAKVMEDLETAFKKFESGGLSGVLELEGTLATIQQTHKLLADAGLALDPWPMLLGEVNEVVSPASCRGRILTHTLTALMVDLFANWRYCGTTSRFVASPLPVKATAYNGTPAVIDKNLGAGRMCGKAFEQVFALGREFVGRPHLECLLRVLGSAELPLLVEGVLQFMESKVADIKGWTDALVEGLEPIRLPMYDKGHSGGYVFFEGKLADFLKYEDLKTGVFQDFRELGNVLVFLRDLSHLLEAQDCLKYVHSVPLVGVVSSKSWDPEHTRILAAVTGVALAARKSCSPASAADAAALVGKVRTGQEMCRGFSHTSSLFKCAVARLEEACDRAGARVAWRGLAAASGVVETEDSLEFHRLFSVLNFLFCMSEASYTEAGGQVVDYEQFGDGFALAGVTLMHLLGQRHAFEMLDFSYHVLNVYTYEESLLDPSRRPPPVDAASQKRAQAFVWYAYEQRTLHFDLFQVMEHVYPHGVSTRQELTIFHPPKDDQELAERHAHAAAAAARVPRSPAPLTSGRSGGGVADIWSSRSPGGSGDLGMSESARLAALKSSIGNYLGGDAPPPALSFEVEGAPELSLNRTGSAGAGAAAAAAGSATSGPGSAFGAADDDPFAMLDGGFGGSKGAAGSGGGGGMPRTSPPTAGATPPLMGGSPPTRFGPPTGAAPPPGGQR
ncbi:unnamed protein product, partial [Phaeothamnion confervicola]